jgi:hypothetical protein
MKVDKNRMLYILSYLVEIIIKILAIKNFFSFEIWWIWAIFSMENPLYKMKSYFSSQILAKFHPQKKKKNFVTYYPLTHLPFLFLPTQPTKPFFSPHYSSFLLPSTTHPSFVFNCSHSFFPWWVKTSLLKGKASTTFLFFFFLTTLCQWQVAI